MKLFHCFQHDVSLLSITLHEMAVHANEQSSLFGFNTPDSFSVLIYKLDSIIDLYHFIAQWTVLIDTGINFHDQ